MPERLPKPTPDQATDLPAAAPAQPERSRPVADRRPPAGARPAPEIRHLPLAPGGSDDLRASVYFDLDDDRQGAASGARRAAGSTRPVRTLRALARTGWMRPLAWAGYDGQAAWLREMGRGGRCRPCPG